MIPQTRPHSLPLKNIKIDDSYWNKYIKLVPDVVIPYQWKILNDQVPGATKSYCIQNFKIAAGEIRGKRKGVVFADSDLAKWLETVAYSLETVPNPELEKTADEVIDLIAAAQCDDGYINTYFTLVEPEQRWKNLIEGHELYTAGHFIEAAVAYYEATGKDKFLKTICRFADLICKTFGKADNQIHGYPGHQEIELALVKLYKTTGDRKYLEQAKYFIDARGGKPNYFLQEMKREGFRHIFPEFEEYTPIYSQSDKPVRKQTKAEGHAVRATYMYCAMADLADAFQDKELMECCKKIWSNIVQKQMYITGSIGSSAFMERFTTDYDLPNDRNYSETCASVGLALLGKRMGEIERDASYYDIVELALYNTVCSGISLNGDRYFYVNPLEVWPDNCLDHTSMSHVKPIRQKWFDVACCPTNVARTLASLGQYIFSVNTNGLFVNLWIQSKADFKINNQDVRILLKTDFPRTSRFNLIINTSGDSEFSIYIRIPNYSKNCIFEINGKKVDYSVENNYACLKKRWKNDSITFKFDMSAELVSANPNVWADNNKVAIVRGPQVFCLEETDNFSNLHSIIVSRSADLKESYDNSLLGGTTVIQLEAKKISTDNWLDNELYKAKRPKFTAVTLTAIPYAYWANREPGEMLVWINAES